MADKNTTRRRFLRAGTAATVLSLAGCSGGGGDGGDGGDGATEAPSDGTEPPGTAADGTATAGDDETTTDEGDDVPTEPPSTSFAIDQRALAGVAVTHDGGDPVATERLTVRVGDTVAYEGGAFRNGFGEGTVAANGWSDEVTAGDELVVAPAGDLSTDGEATVTWAAAGESTELASASLSAPSYSLASVLPFSIGRGIGRELRTGFDTAANQLRAAGPYEFQAKDSELNPSLATGLVDQFVDDGGDAVVGPAIQPALKEVGRTLREAGAVANSPASAGANLANVDGAGNLFRTIPTVASQGRALARVLERDDGSPSVTVVTGQTGGATRFLDGFTGAYAGEVVAVERVARDGNFSGAVERALGTDPEALVAEPFGLNVGQFGRAVFDDPGVGSVPTRGGTSLQFAAERYDGTVPDVAGVSPDPVGSDVEQITAQFGSAGISDPDHFAYTTFDATAVTALAVAYADATGLSTPDTLRAVASPDGEIVTPTALGDGVERALRGRPIAYQGVARSVEYDDAGDLATPTLATWSYENGSVTVDGEVETG